MRDIAALSRYERQPWSSTANRSAACRPMRAESGHGQQAVPWCRRRVLTCYCWLTRLGIRLSLFAQMGFIRDR